MKLPTRHLVPALLALGLLPAITATAAPAPAPTRVFVASTGSDTAAGSRTAPLRNLQAAHNLVAAGGEIVVLDTAGYGSLAITKALAITVPPGVNGFISIGNGTPGISINAGASDVVSLSGVIVEGSGIGTGVNVLAVGTLHLEGCTVRNVATGLLSSATAAHIVANACSVREVGQGIVLSSTSGGAADVVLSHCMVDVVGGVALSATASGGGSSAEVTASNCVVSHSATAVAVDGAGAAFYADNCLLSGDAIGLSRSNSGNLVTRGNNTAINVGGSVGFTATLPAE